MKRKFMILSAALGVAGFLISAGSAAAQPGAAAPGAPAAAPATRPTVAVFNMAAVMREFGQAKFQVWLLNNKKNDLSKNLLNWRGEYVKIQNELKINPNAPDREAKNQQLVNLIRQIEDEDRKISKTLNDDASAIICDLYDKMKAVVDKTAELNGYHIVFAFPDAVTEEEKKNAYIKELKLKPPAAQPFFVAAHADITAVVVKTLNSWYPPVEPGTNKPISMAQLDEMMRVQAQSQPAGAAPGNGPGGLPTGGGAPPRPAQPGLPPVRPQGP